MATAAGPVRDRSQSQTPNGDWTKRDTETGRYMDGSKERFKGRPAGEEVAGARDGGAPITPVPGPAR